MDFYKYHGLGNDYLVIDPQEIKIDLTPERIKLICNRHFGLGSDGILYGPILKNNKISLRIFNPDGSEAEKSGNGIRIFSRYLIDSNYVVDKKFRLETLGGSVHVEILDTDAGLIKVNMGKVTFTSDEIPVKGEKRDVIDEPLELDGNIYKITCLSIGNPHCVIPMDNISKMLALNIGQKIENHPMFPKRINMQLLTIIDKKNIKIEIWERGAGYTLASGSSSCAAASAAYKLGLVDNKINVHMPGGMLKIEIDEKLNVHMIGSVSSVCEGNFSKEMWDRISRE